MKTSNEDNCVDLHVHTTCSDGTLSPEEVVRKAAELGLRAIAITDHDCVDGIPGSMRAAEGTALEIVPGVELSSSKDETDIHVLGYFVDWEDPGLLRTLRGMQERRVERISEMVRLLGRQGVDISEKKVFEEASGNLVGRLHLARVMVRENIAGDIREAFDRYIGNNRPCYVRYKRLDYRKAIEVIRKAGGVPVLAHPGTMGKDENIPSYVEAGLRGIEVFYTKHNPGMSGKYREIAGKYGLLATGGSDYHGKEEKSISIGQVRVGYKVVEDLRREAELIREQVRENSG